MQLLVLLLSQVAVVTAIAGCLSDRDKDHRLRQNCTAAGFSDLPEGVEPETQVLLFPANRFSALSWTSFQIFSNIYEIDLTANEVPRPLYPPHLNIDGALTQSDASVVLQVPEVPPSPAAVLTRLSVLRLGSNRLTGLAGGSFTACPALIELYLENNSIAALSDHAFSGLDKLEILDLTYNQISVLPGLMMRPLVAIETLYLEANQIQLVPDDWFSPKEEVLYLYLSANPWACSCSLGYLRRYMDDYELNFYVRDGRDIRSAPDSVVCDSPERHRSVPLVSIEESDLCPAELPPRGDLLPVLTERPHLTTPAPQPPPSPSPPPAETTLPPTAPPHEVVSWIWIQNFTRFHVWSYSSDSEETGGVLQVWPEETVTPPEDQTWSRNPTSTSRTPTSRTSTSRTPTSRTSTIRTWTPTTGTSTSRPSAAAVGGATARPSRRGGVSVRWVSAAAAGVFCVWLFAGCVLLCTVSAACTFLTLVKMVTWYREVYTPLAAAQRAGHEERVLLRPVGMEGGAGGAGEAGGVRALYRSVLFIHRDTTEGGAAGGVRGEESGVYRKTMFRLLSREEEVQGWREVMEECRTRPQEGGGGASRKRYSVILREEREGSAGRREELDWVVGGWEVSRGRGEEGEGLRSSWGEWLAQYLPSMPWSVTTPSQMK
ncbi:Platelet glycoprotein Ib alpha chain [Oryzias melastigma]|uniref:Platelet glycoprotein Ib alpha chain n=1 Tax=Oryzias melastigma TaxID=30732 RepID=A0A834FCI2_ORYME|nr:Platelet glycoprotein Ib alpha chain [Oryzias melastigma]